jgi:hypothetical protein
MGLTKKKFSGKSAPKNRFRQISTGHWLVNNVIDLVHSPDENGYYFQEHCTSGVLNRVSQIFPTFVDAESAYRNNSIKWGEWS